MAVTLQGENNVLLHISKLANFSVFNDPVVVEVSPVFALHFLQSHASPWHRPVTFLFAFLTLF